MAYTIVTYYNWRRMLMLRYTIHVNTPCISTMPALVHFLILYHNRNLSIIQGSQFGFFEAKFVIFRLFSTPLTFLFLKNGQIKFGIFGHF